MMSKTPRTDAVRTDAAHGYSRNERDIGVMFLIAEMLERIATALEQEKRK